VGTGGMLGLLAQICHDTGTTGGIHRTLLICDYQYWRILHNDHHHRPEYPPDIMHYALSASLENRKQHWTIYADDANRRTVISEITWTWCVTSASDPKQYHEHVANTDVFCALLPLTSTTLFRAARILWDTRRRTSAINREFRNST